MLTPFESAHTHLPGGKLTGRYPPKTIPQRSSIKEVASFLGKDASQQIGADRQGHPIRQTGKGLLPCSISLQVSPSGVRRP